MGEPRRQEQHVLDDVLLQEEALEQGGLSSLVPREQGSSEGVTCRHTSAATAAVNNMSVQSGVHRYIAHSLSMKCPGYVIKYSSYQRSPPLTLAQAPHPMWFG